MLHLSCLPADAELPLPPIVQYGSSTNGEPRRRKREQQVVTPRLDSRRKRSAADNIRLARESGPRVRQARAPLCRQFTTPAARFLLSAKMINSGSCHVGDHVARTGPPEGTSASPPASPSFSPRRPPTRSALVIPHVSCHAHIHAGLCHKHSCAGVHCICRLHNPASLSQLASRSLC